MLAVMEDCVGECSSNEEEKHRPPTRRHQMMAPNCDILMLTEIDIPDASLNEVAKPTDCGTAEKMAGLLWCSNFREEIRSH